MTWISGKGRFRRILALGGLGYLSMGLGWVYAREDLIPGSPYTSARGAALGDAYLPLGDDVPSGLFYNPADLGKLRKAQVEPLNLSIYGNSGYTSTLNGNFYNVFNKGSFSSNLQSSPNKWLGAGGSVIASFGVPGFALGVLTQTQVNSIYNSSASTVSYRSLYQFIPTLGTGFRLAGGMIRIGYSLQWVNQAVGSQTVASTSSAGFSDNLAQGSGFSNNFGLALTAPIKALPSFNFVVRNAFGTYYSSRSIIPFSPSSTGAPPTDPMTFDASFSLHPRLGRGVILNLVLADRDLTNQSGDAFIAHFALGAEINFRDHFFLRGGWGGGYPSCGVGLKSGGVELSLAWYTEELGTQYMGQGDTRYMFQYQIRAF